MVTGTLDPIPPRAAAAGTELVSSWFVAVMAAPLGLAIALAFEEPLWAAFPLLILLGVGGALVRWSASFLFALFPLLNVHHVSTLNVLFVCGGILLLWIERSLPHGSAERIRGLELGLLLATLLALHPVPGASRPLEAFGQWIYDYAPVVLYVLIVRSGIRGDFVPGALRLLLIAIIVASLTVVADGLANPGRRAVGWVEPKPTGTAYDLVMFVPIGLAMFAAGKARMLGATAALLALAAIFFTGSRMPFAAALLLSFPFVRSHRFGIPVVGLLVLMAMYQTGGGIVHRLDSIEGEVTAIDASSMIRIVLWGLSIEILQAHPWLGIGYGEFLGWAKQAFQHHSFLLGHSHNIALEKMVQVGIPLALFYLSLIGLLLGRNWRNYRRMRAEVEDGDRQIFLGLFFGALAMLACGITDAVLNGPNQPLLFWMVMALQTIWVEHLRRRAGGAV
jgi:hypothetical protein